MVVAVLMLSLTLTSCTTYENFKEGLGNETSDEVVRIGIFEPLSGPDGSYGKLEKQGIELAYSLYPEVLGKKVKLIYEDNRSDPDYSEVAAEKLIKNRVSVVLGSYGSSNSMIGGSLFEKARIPAIGITCTNPLVTSINPYYFRVCFIDTFQGAVMAKHAFEHDGAVKAAIIQEKDNDYYGTLAQVFADKFKELTGDEAPIVSTTNYNKGDTDFQSQINAIKAAEPEVLFIPGQTAEAGLIMKQARDAGIKAEFLGIYEWDNDQSLIDIAGAAAEGCVFMSLYDPNILMTKQTQIFLDAYKLKYGQDAEPSRAEALGFDAYLAALDGISRAGTATNGQALMESLLLTRELPGVTGEITFDPKGDAIKPAVIKTVLNGAFIYSSKTVPVWE
jgi:branched-chain amino acid transport system substrate-binding protein